MSQTVEGLLAVWAIVGIIAGVGVGMFIDDLTKRDVSVDARVAAGLMVLLFTPLIAPAYLLVGGHSLYRTFVPKKVTLPEARAIR